MNSPSKLRIWTAAAILSGAMFIGGVVVAETSHSTAKFEAPIFATAPKNAAMAALRTGYQGSIARSGEYRFVTHGSSFR